MIVDTGKFRLFESWSLTRGHAGSMFLIALALIVGLIVVEGLLALILVGFSAGLTGSVGQPSAIAGLQGAITRLEPLLIVVAIVSVPIFGAAMALFTAPWAYVYRQLGRDAIDAPFT